MATDPFIFVAAMGKTLHSIGEALRDSVIQEFRAQGHSLTGAVEREIDINVMAVVKQLSVSLGMLHFVPFLDSGVAADKIPFYPGSGRKYSKYIAGLQRFALLRNMAFSDKEALSVAFAIAYKHKAEGMPTGGPPSRGSYAFSTNQRRTKFIEEGSKAVMDKVEELAGEGLQTAVFKTICGILEGFNSPYIN